MANLVNLNAESLADLLLENDLGFLTKVYLPTFENETAKLFMRLSKLPKETLNKIVLHEKFSYGTYEDLFFGEMMEEVS